MASAEESQVKKSKTRSPNHPVIGLPKAVELTGQLSKKFGVHEAPIGLVRELWEFNPGSAAVGNQYVAALKAYGLVDVTGDGEGRKVAITKDGERIVHNAPDRPELLKKAAIGPKIHAEILDHYGDKGLPDNSLLKQYLLWERPEGQRFNRDAVDGFIERFRDALAFASIESSDIITDSEDKSDPPQPVAEKELEDGDGHKPQPQKKRPMQPGTKQDVFTLDEGAVVLEWPERISQESAQDLEDWLNLIIKKAKRTAKAHQPEVDSDE